MVRPQGSLWCLSEFVKKGWKAHKDSTIDTIYGQTIECECGKIHQIEPERVIYENGALVRLPEVLSEYTTCMRFVPASPL